MKTIFRISFVLFFIVSTAAYAGGGHGKHGWFHDWSQYDEMLDLTDEQQAMMSQLQSAQIMLQNMMTNIAANSLDENGDFDHDIFDEQMSQNQLVIDDVKTTMMAFKESLSEEQLATLKAWYKDQKKGCRDKHGKDGY